MEIKCHITGFQNTMELVHVYQNYMGEITQTIRRGKQFAVLLCNFLSSVSFNGCIPGLKTKSELERFEIGYGFIDRWAKDVMKLLETENMLENTIVVFYGGHGGLNHAIEPYANLIRTPFGILTGGC